MIREMGHHAGASADAGGEVAEIAGGLTDALREAISVLTDQPQTMLAAMHHGCGGATADQRRMVDEAQAATDLIEQVSSCPHTFRLTPLGLAIRAHLLSQTTQEDDHG